MNKALIVFKGDYALEQNLPTDVVSWDVLGMNTTCANCTVNRFAAQGYLECKQATNNWQQIVAAYAGQGLVFSIAGHGLGGMHSLIASADLNSRACDRDGQCSLTPTVENIDYYSHNYGTPRTFNAAGGALTGKRRGRRGACSSLSFSCPSADPPKPDGTMIGSTARLASAECVYAAGRELLTPLRSRTAT